MTYGLTPEQHQFISENVVIPLSQKGAQVYCYGSRARGDHNPFSDLDLMVESSLDMSKDVAKLTELLSNSNFPFKVDLVEFSNFAESYKPGYFKDRQKFM